MQRDKKWHAVYVNSRAEKKVYAALVSRKLDAYLPIVKTMRQWSDRKKLVQVPLFSGYVFVSITAAEYDRVLETPGVVSYVRSEGKVARIRDEEIARLRELVDLGYQIEARPAKKNLKTGTKVRIGSGVLKGIEGFVVGTGDQRRVELLLESIGHTLIVRLPEEILLEI